MEPWNCLGCGAVMGQIRVKANGWEELLLYRVSVQLNDDAPADVDVGGIIPKKVEKWICFCCGTPRTWVSRQVRPMVREPRVYSAE